ncbi:MAG: oligosaccharide flippase family protein, partial [Candidatus Latescibacteria bacterium]|nr:oligosaccharide flippase family protein [bacterium]MBD3422872.1 oligosaccharide flippase family protein [Candidatus Latescibacterota bacterium]
MRRKSKLLENTVSLVICGGFSIVFTLIQLGILSRYLDAEKFGTFIALRGLLVLLATVNLLGLPQVLMRYLPSYQERENRRRAILLLIYSTAVVIVFGGALYAGSRFWMDWIPSGLNEGVSGVGLAPLVTLAAVSLALKLLLYGGFKGLRVMSTQMILELLYLGMFTGYIFMIREDLSIPILFKALAGANLLVCLAGYPLYFIMTSRLIGSRELRRDHIILPSFRSYWGISVILSLVALAFQDVDRFLMTSLVPVGLISVFHIAERINKLIKRFLGFPIIALQPEVTRIYEEGRWDELKGQIRLFTKVSLSISILMAAAAAVVGKQVIVMISGSEYASAYPVLLILLPAVPVAAFIAPLLVTMKALHFVKWALLCDFLWMLFYFGGFPFLIMLWGLKGMAVAQLLGAAAQMTAAVAIAKRKGFYGGVGGRFGALAGIALAAALAGIFLAEYTGVAGALFWLAAFPFITKAVFAWSGFLEPGDREQIKSMVRYRSGKKV